MSDIVLSDLRRPYTTLNENPNLFLLKIFNQTKITFNVIYLNIKQR